MVYNNEQMKKKREEGGRKKCWKILFIWRNKNMLKYNTQHKIRFSVLFSSWKKAACKKRFEKKEEEGVGEWEAEGWASEWESKND